MIDAEELYYKLYRVVEDEGLNLDIDEADALLEQFCTTVVDENAGITAASAPDPHSNWQTYSRQGNQLMEALFRKLEMDLREGHVSRKDLAEVMRERLEILEKEFPGQGYSDSEPRGELTDQVNKVLDELMYKEISYWDW